MLVKGKFTDHTTLLNETQSPYVLWVKFNKEAFGIACIIGSIYLPGENSTHRDNERFESITSDIFALKHSYNLPICLIGDMNSRTGNLDDSLVVEHSIINNCEIEDFAEELFDLSNNEVTSNMSKERSNKDVVINNYGRQLIDFCKINNLKIINGRIGSDKGIGDFTYNSTIGSSTIDYCITSHNFLPHILDFEVDILDKTLSDAHSPIILTLKINLNNTNENEVETNPSLECGIEYEQIYSKWNNDKKSEFQAKFNLSQIDHINQILDTFEFDIPNQRDIDDIVKTISEISIMAGLETGLSKQIISITNNQKKDKENKPWFDNECQKKRKHYIKIRNRLKKRKSFQDVATLKNESKSYKKFINKKRHEFNKTLHNKLRELKSTKPKEYWKLLSPKKQNRNNSINLNSLYNHFKLLNDDPNNGTAHFDVNDISENGNEVLNNEFSPDEINKLINKLKK